MQLLRIFFFSRCPRACIHRAACFNLASLHACLYSKIFPLYFLQLDVGNDVQQHRDATPSSGRAARVVVHDHDSASGNVRHYLAPRCSPRCATSASAVCSRNTCMAIGLSHSTNLTHTFSGNNVALLNYNVRVGSGTAGTVR